MVTKKTIFILLLSILISSVWVGNGILGAEKISPQAEETLRVPISKEFGEKQRYVITFKEKPFGYKDFIISLGGRVTHDYTIIEGIAVEVPTAAAERLVELPNIRSIQLDEVRFASLTESVPLINADDVWAEGYSGTGKNVCIIDTGVDYNHSALSGKVLKQKCYCLGNAGPSGCCPGGGEVEDNALDDAGHGTHVAGIVASNDSTYKGVAYGANIYAVKVLDSAGSGYLSDVIAGINWCRDNGADVINLSLGGATKFTSYCDGQTDAQAVNNAVDAGKFVAIASGNSAWTDGISSPACASKGTSVGDVYDANVGGIGWGSPLVCSDSTTAPDKIVCHCNRGSILDMLAPGALINSAKLGGGFIEYGGTSMAAPHVAGVAALLLEAKPTLTPAEIENVLKSTGVNITDTGGSGLTFPRIDVLAAFNQIYVAGVGVKTFRDSSYSQEDKFFNLGETIYIQANVIAGGTPVTGATVTAELILSSSTTEATLPLTEIGSGIYRNSWNSSSHTLDAYTIKVTVSGPVTGEGKAYFHLYSGSGVSAYQLDWDNDTLKDYVLENKHLIAIFDGATNTDKSLLYLYQKDTDVAYNFLGISDTDTIGRGEVSTADLGNLKFHTFSLPQLGENLSSTTFEVKTELAGSGGTGQSAMFDDDDTGGRDPVGAGMKAGFTTASFGTLEFWTRCRAQTSGDSFDIMLENSGGTVGPDIYLLGGNIGYYDGAQRTIMAYTPDQWYHFKIAFDATTDTMDIYIDDMENPKTTGAGFWGSVADINQIEFDTGQWLSGTPARDRFDPLCYVDDINIYSGETSLLTEDFEDDTAGADPNSPWTVIEDSASTNVEISNTVYHQGSIESTLDLSIQMKSEDVDYLVYKLSNFDEYIDDINDIFSPISGALGSNINDDRYHFGDGTDGSITSLTPNTWTNFSTTTNQQRYVAIYDNSTTGDPVSDNVISWIYFPNASSTAFQDVGLWYETGKEGLRIRYDTTSATGANQAEYILALTQGDYNTIDQWMSAIASGNYPETNFMSSHDVAVTDMVAPGSVAQGDTAKIDVYVANEGTFTETFDVVLEDTTSSTEIGRETVTSLGPSQFTTIIFDWVTDGSTGLGIHTLEAFAGPVAGEVDTADNSMTIEVEVVVISVLEMSFQDGVYPTSTYSGTRDTELKIFSPDEWEGDDLDFAIDGIDANEERNALVKWDISAIPSGSTITSASITLTTDTNASDETFPIYECLKDWVEATATATIYDKDKYWGTLGAKNITDDPDRGTTVLGYVYGSVKDTTYTFNLNSDGVSLVQSWVDSPGTNYGITIQKATATNAIHYRSRDSDTANLRPKLTVSYTEGKVLTRSDFPANLWQMISVPLQPENADPEAVLSDDLGNIFYNWTLARWQPFEGVYKYHKAVCCPWTASSTSILPNFSPGLGYWLNARLGPTDIDVSGDLTLDNDYYIHLSPGTSTETGGWNQIAVPFNYSVDWSSSTIKVKNTQTEETVDIDTAQANNWLENKIWWRDGTSTQYSFAIAPEGQLDPWAGYWVHNFIECDLIVSPTPMQGAGAQVASIDTLQEIQSDFSEKTEKQAGKSQQKWQDYLPEWKIQLLISADSKKDTYNFAGISPAAKDDYDALDVLEPPPISKGINLYFPHQDFAFNPGNYTQDIKESDFKNKEWNFEIKSDLQQTAITLKWLGLQQIEYYDLSLIDLDANQTIDIYNTTNYTFELEKGGIRHFELTAKVMPGRGKLFKE